MFKKWSKILKKNCIGSKKYKKIKNVSIPVDKKLIEKLCDEIAEVVRERLI